MPAAFKHEKKGVGGKRQQKAENSPQMPTACAALTLILKFHCRDCKWASLIKAALVTWRRFIALMWQSAADSHASDHLSAIIHQTSECPGLSWFLLDSHSGDKLLLEMLLFFLLNATLVERRNVKRWLTSLYSWLNDVSQPPFGCWMRFQRWTNAAIVLCLFLAAALMPHCAVPLSCNRIYMEVGPPFKQNLCCGKR